MKRDKITNKRILRVLAQNFCNVSKAAQKLKINRRTLQRWIEDDEDLKNDFHDMLEGDKDEAESELRKWIYEEKSITALLFYLKTKCRDRGYVERKEEVKFKEQPLFNIDPEKLTL